MKKNDVFWFLVTIITLIGMTLPASAVSEFHMGQDVVDHVLLVSNYVDPNDRTVPHCNEGSFSAAIDPGGFKGFFRQFPDGTQTAPFLVPNGRLLVITDVEWRSRMTGTEAQNNKYAQMLIHTEKPTPAFSGSSLVFLSELIPIFTPNEGQLAEVGENDQLTTGFMVSPDRVICPYLLRGPFLHKVDQIVLRGYLVDD